MIFTLLLMLVIIGTSIAVAGVLHSQVQPTALAKKYVRTVNGAQAGMQNALAQMRAANDGASAGVNVGNAIKLPCSDTADETRFGGGGVKLDVGEPATTFGVPGYAITGTVANDGNSNDTIGYNVSVVYFTSDPTAHEDDATSTWWTTNAMPCRGGIVQGVPGFAFIQSTGTGVGVPGLPSQTDGNRSLQGMYQFQQTNTFGVGGRLAEYNSAASGTKLLCLDAGSAPTVGTVPTMESCQAIGTPQQTWQYRTDLTIYYGGNPGLNLCIQNVSGTPMLETCTSAVNTPAATTYPYTAGQQPQEWGFNDNGHLSAALSNGDVTESTGGSCLEPAGATSSTPASAGAALAITSCDSATTGYTAWNPDPQVGAGSALNYYTGAPGQVKPQGVPASSPTSQFVNFAEFGRCLDVTGQNQNAAYLIDYPCKQAPSSCNLTWNQVWSFTPMAQFPNSTYGNSYGEFISDYAGSRHNCDPPGTNYCLTATSSTVNSYVNITPCGASPTDFQLWDATGQQSTYDQSYLLVNRATGLCLAADPNQQPTFGSSTIVATNCDGTQIPSGSGTKDPLLMKWNAPPDAQDFGLRNVQEQTGQL